ncbi:MAG: FAD-binding domain-containing protein [Acidimicrobiales bacterium]
MATTSALICDEPSGSLRFRGGQAAADEALRSFDVSGYDRRRNEVYPTPRRGASALSPYIRHGLLTLDRVWQHVDGGPVSDVAKFRSELLWQEYARHWYARLGRSTRQGVRADQPVVDASWNAAELYDRDMACMDLTLGELEEDGWLVNQSRMWLASHWSVRSAAPWNEGEDFFFRHLIDGSRAANRLGWQWTAGLASAKSYSFSRWQVEERAAGLCASCEKVHDCPVETWPEPVAPVPHDEPVTLRKGNDAAIAGPATPIISTAPDTVWLTAESLGTADPALVAHPDLPVVFVFDEPLLASLSLSGKRLVFLTETLAELATSRDLELRLGRPADELRGRKVAVTHAPVPGFVRRSGDIGPVAVHPYPWYVRLNGGTVRSFSAWLARHRPPIRLQR